MSSNFILAQKLSKKDKKELKEEIAKVVVTSVMESIELKIQNQIEQVSVDLNLGDQAKSQSDLQAKMDQSDLKHEEIEKKMDDIILDVARLTDKVKSATDRAIRVEEWKDSGLVCSKEDLFLFAWGMACIQTR